jgi:hypothetical protein
MVGLLDHALSAPITGAPLASDRDKAARHGTTRALTTRRELRRVVSALAGDPDDLFIRITGPAAAWPTAMAVCLSDKNAARSALTERRSLQMALTALLAHAADIRLSVVLAPTRNEPAIL